MDKQPYIERMLEIENLTDELEDSDANWLLDWGTGQMDAVLQGAEDAKTAGKRANALMAVMRKINRIAGSYADKSSQSLAGDLGALYDLLQQAFGHTRPAPQNGSASESETRAGAAEGKKPSAEEEKISAETDEKAEKAEKPSAEAEKPPAKERKATGEMRAEEMEDRAEGKYPVRRAPQRDVPKQQAAEGASARSARSYPYQGKSEQETTGDEPASQSQSKDEKPAKAEERAERATAQNAQAAPTEAELKAAARQLSELDTRQALEFLTRWYFQDPNP